MIRRCGVCGSCRCHGDDNDARLIAAAPELLEALERLTNLGEHLAEEHMLAEDDPVKGSHVRKFNRLLDKARAAIAKAKGERK
jgi:hypothetical protein